MAKYRKLYPRFWTSRDSRQLGPTDKLIAAYCMTCDQSNRCGLFVFSAAMGAERLGVSREQFEAGLDRVCDAMSWQYDRAVGVLFIPSWWKWNRPDNWKLLKGALKDLEELPATELLDQFYAVSAEILGDLWTTHWDGQCHTQSIPNQLGMPFQEQEKEQEQKKQQEKKNVGTEPAHADSVPTADELSEFAFPIVGNGPKTWTLPKRKLAEYAESFPGVDIDGQLRKMRQWCRDNPTKRKTARGMGAFITRWLSLEQDTGQNRRNPTVPVQSKADAAADEWLRRKAEREKHGQF